MKTFKIVVFAALIIFHVTAIILISVGRNNFDFLLNLFNKLDLMMYGAYLGLLLFATTILFDFLNRKGIKTLNKKHQEEINELKAKLYDKKEDSNKAAVSTEIKTENPSSQEDSETRVD